MCCSIHDIPDETFEDLHSLEWLKLWNNELEGLSYSLMEPVLDTLKHLDIHSESQTLISTQLWRQMHLNILNIVTKNVKNLDIASENKNSHF